jgi:hypothetical protein
MTVCHRCTVIYDEIKKRHRNFVIDHRISCSDHERRRNLAGERFVGEVQRLRLLSRPSGVPPASPFTGRNSVLRLSALVILQIHPLNRIFLLHHSDFTIPYQIFRTRHPLNLVLHTNYPMRGPLVILFLSPSLPTPPTLSLSPLGESARTSSPRAAATAPNQELLLPL